MFHVLNPRQASIYVYLTMLCDDKGSCHPTIDQIREDLALLSSSMVYEALTVLEDFGFIMRERQAYADTGSRGNLYRRTACEFTIKRLLERDEIDGLLRPNDPIGAPASDESRALASEGLRALLGNSFERYERATPAAKKDVMIEILDQVLETRERGIYQ